MTFSLIQGQDEILDSNKKEELRVKSQSWALVVRAELAKVLYPSSTDNPRTSLEMDGGHQSTLWVDFLDHNFSCFKKVDIKIFLMWGQTRSWLLSWLNMTIFWQITHFGLLQQSQKSYTDWLSWCEITEVNTLRENSNIT